MAKRYFWLKLKDDFFNSIRIKKLRKMAGGDTYTIIYLKMQLLAMKKDGVLTYTGVEDTFAEELSLDIDEDIDNVKMTLAYLMNVGLCETSDNVNFFLPYAIENTGSEGASAQRMREHRQSQLIEAEPKEAKHFCGECSNVLLTDKEVEALKEKYKENYDYVINYFSSQKEAKGYKYKSDYRAILNWDIKIKEKKEGSFDTDDFFEASLKRSYGND